jgi:6-pyruvoyltetrahydropterin/6-carboxytetrahydropterin synthase
MRPDGQVKSDLTSSDRGMVWDFSTLKKAVQLVILDKVDHAFMYNETDKESTEIATFMKERINQKLCPVPFRATAEVMALWIGEELQEFFDTMNYNVLVTKIILYETPTSYSTWEMPAHKIREFTSEEEDV